MCIKLTCIQVKLETAFYRYGKIVARHPYPFILCPLLFVCLCTIGLLNLHSNSDTEYLYTPTNGPAKEERRLIRKYFYENDTHYFIPTRKTGIDGFVNIYLTNGNDRGNIFTNHTLTKVIELHNAVINNDFEDDGTTFRNVCAKYNGNCFIGNSLIQALNGSAQTIDFMPIEYPVHRNRYFLASELGGVIVNGQGHIERVEAIALNFFVLYQSEEDMIKANKWLTNLKLYLLDSYNDSDLTVNFRTSLSLDEELAKSTEGIPTFIVITFTIIFGFCSVSCAMADWVRTKFWVSLAGQVASAMAILSSIGLLCGAGLPITTTVVSMPFLIIGVGIDDMFVILSSWRHTSFTLPVSERMGLTMKIAAISITVTSITNALAFGVGSISVFNSVTLFCAFTGVAVVFAYIYAITFLAGFFSLSGHGESKNLHEFTCQKIVPAEKAGNKSRLYRMFCTGGHVQEPDENIPDNMLYMHPVSTTFIERYYAPIVLHRLVKFIVAMLYLAYLGFAIYGCYILEEGLKIENLSVESSYLRPYYRTREKYFTQNNGPRIMLAFIEEIDYSNTDTRNAVLNQTKKFQESPYFFQGDEYIESWLSAYMRFLTVTNQTNNVQNMTAFIHILRHQFFRSSLPASVFQLDVVFNEDYTQIVASRFLIQSMDSTDSTFRQSIMQDSRKFAQQSEFNIIVFHPLFIFWDQYVVIFEITMQSIIIAVISMLIVSVLFLPSFVSSVCVTLSVVSIVIGVMGYMSLWEVNLDSVSMILLIMSIGFSVDFSAHISYHFAISTEANSNAKVAKSLVYIGTPILQSVASTILGVSVLSASESYIFQTFFKLLFLVMVFGFIHSMAFLPVFLSCLPERKHSSTNVERELQNEKSNKI